MLQLANSPICVLVSHLQLSFASTLSLCAFITHLVIRYRGIATSSTPSSTGIRFLRTPAGYIFLNLLAADTTQALGFALTWHWARRGGIDASSQLCLLQAVAIQAGDVASCIFSLYIAIYTATLLTIARRPSDKLLHISCGSAWLFVALMTCLGPLAVAKQDKGPFYGQAGNWCWIATPYEGYRLYFHYLLVRTGSFHCTCNCSDLTVSSDLRLHCGTIVLLPGYIRRKLKEFSHLS